MQMEWNRWLAGLTNLKEGTGFMWLFCLAVLVWQWHRKEQKVQWLIKFSVIMGVLVIFPITAAALLKVFTPFYDWLDLQLLVPAVLLLAWGGTELTAYLNQMQIPGLHLKENAKTIISILCVAVLFFAGAVFHGFDRGTEADENGVPIRIAAAFAVLKEEIGNDPIVIAAPSRLLQYLRMYEENWQPLYGRDLWDPKAASYINSGYQVEYAYYEFLEKEYLQLEEIDKFIELTEEGPAECVIAPATILYLIEDKIDYRILKLTDSYIGIIKR